MNLERKALILAAKSGCSIQTTRRFLSGKSVHDSTARHLTDCLRKTGKPTWRKLYPLTEEEKGLSGFAQMMLAHLIKYPDTEEGILFDHGWGSEMLAEAMELLGAAKNEEGMVSNILSELRVAGFLVAKNGKIAIRDYAKHMPMVDE